MLTTQPKPADLAHGESRSFRLTPGEGTAQIVDRITILRRGNGDYDVTMYGEGNGRRWAVLQTAHRRFPTYRQAADYANGFIRANGRSVAR